MEIVAISEAISQSFLCVINSQKVTIDDIEQPLNNLFKNAIFLITIHDL